MALILKTVPAARGPRWIGDAFRLYARRPLAFTLLFVVFLFAALVVAQVPLFGPILGGGQDEGLFAVNFRISGLASEPTLTVNPLSAVAPGFLRKLFGAGSGASDATGAMLMPPARTER